MSISLNQIERDCIPSYSIRQVGDCSVLSLVDLYGRADQQFFFISQPISIQNKNKLFELALHLCNLIKMNYRG